MFVRQTFRTKNGQRHAYWPLVESYRTASGPRQRVVAWMMDRGMVSEGNIEFLRDGVRRYVIGTPKSMLKKFEQDILKDDWHEWRCPREFSVLEHVNCYDRAALKNAILRVHEFEESFPRAGMMSMA